MLEAPSAPKNVAAGGGEAAKALQTLMPQSPNCVHVVLVFLRRLKSNLADLNSILCLEVLKWCDSDTELDTGRRSLIMPDKTKTEPPVSFATYYATLLSQLANSVHSFYVSIHNTATLQ